MGIIENMVKDLADLLSSVVSVSIQPAGEVGKDSLHPEKIYPRYYGKEPIIDVIKTKNKIRVIATLAGIKKEDVWFEVKERVLAIEITKYGRVYRREIPCNVKPDQVSVKSTTLNNSILEMVFVKKQAGKKSAKPKPAKNS